MQQGARAVRVLDAWGAAGPAGGRLIGHLLGRLGVQPSVELEVIESRIVERAQEERWDLIVLEASGAWRGSNLTKTLRAQGVKAPILQLNGYADDIDEASQAGADCVILLPFMPLAFRDAMADLIGI